MSEEFDPKEEQCFNVYWKIKNFSFCSEEITTPGFFLSGFPWCLTLRPKDINCRLLVLSDDYKYRRLTFQVSFLPSDGSTPLHAKKGQCLQVSKDVLFGTRRSAFLPKDTLTVQFRYPTFSERGKLLVRSRIGVKYETFLWILKNFNQDPRNLKNMKKSIKKSERYGEIELVLKSVGGFHTDERFYIEISRKGGEKCYCVLRVSVLDVDGNAVNRISDEFVFEQEDGQQSKCFPSIIRKNKLLASKSQLLPNNTLTLKCCFSITLGTVTDQTSVISYSADATHLVKELDNLSVKFQEGSFEGSFTDLQGDLKSILEDGPLQDVSLHVGSEVIKAHKSILSARSPVFRAMFTKDMREANSNTVLIEDFDVDTVRGLLLFMYTDTIHDEQWENMKSLYLAADKYGVLSLKEKCVSFLKTNLSVSNVCQALVLADLQQDVDLKAIALDFISEYDSEVFVTEEWKELETNNYSLVIQVLRELCCNQRK